MNPTITACMIVRDEEKYLADALASIKDVVDEIVIVDTGSTDKTVEIAKSFGAKVEIHSWKDNFSLHRNQSLAMATKDWMMIFDADDRLYAEDGEKIREHLKDAKSDLVQAIVVSKQPGTCDNILHQIRFIRRGSQFKYYGRIHNRIQLPPRYTIDRSPIRILHIGYALPDDERDKKHNRTKRLLEMEIGETPNEPYLHEHYAKHMRIEGVHQDPVKCFEHASKAAVLTDPRKWAAWWMHLRSLDLMAWSLLQMKKYRESIEIAHQLLYFKPNHLDSMLWMAYGYRGLGDVDSSIQWFSNYIQADEVYDPFKDTDGVQVNFPGMQEMAIAEIEKLKERDSEYYDVIYRNGYGTSRYNKIYDRVIEKLNGTRGVLEVGCGTGDLAKRIFDRGILYQGFDFSKEAIKQSKKKVGHRARLGDVYKKKSYKNGFDYDTIVCLEVLEHIKDLEVLSLMPKGRRIIGSVPDFGDPAHLRAFRNVESVKERYQDRINIKDIETFDQPSGKIFLFEGTLI